MVTSCCAYGCTNSNVKEVCKAKKISFHLFPHSDAELKKKWEVNIKRENFTPSLTTRICSEHFEESCFEYQPFTEKRLLKKDAVPTLFSFSKPPNKKRKINKLSEVSDAQSGYDPGEGTSAGNRRTTSIPHSLDKETQTDIGFDLLIDELAVKHREIEELRRQSSSFDPNMMSSSEVKAVTGFSKNTFIKMYNFFNLEKDFYSGKTAPDKQFLLFLCRLRTGLPLDFIAYIFQMSPSTASRIFTKATEVLYAKIQTVNIWPSREQVDEFMPFAFKKKYPKCRLIIDCTEIRIQQPSNPKEQQLTFSTYKNYNTMKALLGISPSGGITYISELWTGSISDKAAFLETDILQRLERGDVVLADKGFTIAAELESIGCELITPLFLRDKIQFDILERAYNKGVSNLRVHVERAISRIKNFNYFDAIPYNSLHNLDELFHIATFLTNFYGPLIVSTSQEEENTDA
ncbi:uncharacterized protein LOC129218977 [Uloborus diversus]|uniref:uncharacterized protein LOC129218977 n=1 Tax=Uloborus diversus TaxID=327109 RepID=UPI002409E31B|nr:uncharacterized protein LOC129218977 [Uloborus diversus]